jgi:hypothetical protein
LYKHKILIHTKSRASQRLRALKLFSMAFLGLDHSSCCKSHNLSNNKPTIQSPMFDANSQEHLYCNTLLRIMWCVWKGMPRASYCGSSSGPWKSFLYALIPQSFVNLVQVLTQTELYYLKPFFYSAMSQSTLPSCSSQTINILLLKLYMMVAYLINNSHGKFHN